MESSTASIRNDSLFALSILVGGAGFHRSSTLDGVTFWLVFATAFLAATYALGVVACKVVAAEEKPKAVSLFQNLALLLASLALVAVCSEFALALQERAIGTRLAEAAVERPDYPLLLPGTLSDDAYERITRRRGVMTLPPNWEHQPMIIPGSARSYRWHDAIHVHDGHGFRRTTSLPAKQPGTFRLLVVGDSLSYGYGIEEKFTYPKIVEKHLRRDFDIEVVNLGVSAKQSEDVLELLRTFLPRLNPDLVFYGVCLNDFLPSRVGEYRSLNYAFPIPTMVKEFLEARSRLARLVADSYDRALRSAGMRPDFFDDILKDFSDYQRRFGRDVAAMVDLAHAHGDVPLVTMILQQYPKVDGRGHRVAAIAEALLHDAGFDVIDVQSYYRAYHGSRNLQVSPWEGHPNELANALFASLIIRSMRAQPALEPYRRAPRGPSAPAN
jgi:lysophospholipase L1-like esterase